MPRTVLPTTTVCKVNTRYVARRWPWDGLGMALGWPSERVIVIDSDLSRSGAHHGDRPGFEKLIAQVSQGRVGIVLAQDVSRLSRNARDWYHLLETCARRDTLLFVQDDLYDLTQFSDQRALGLQRPASASEPTCCTIQHHPDDKDPGAVPARRRSLNKKELS